MCGGADPRRSMTSAARPGPPTPPGSPPGVSSAVGRIGGTAGGGASRRGLAGRQGGGRGHGQQPSGEVAAGYRRGGDPRAIAAPLHTRRRSGVRPGVGRGKEIVEVDDAEPARAAGTITAIARDADVLFLAGGEELVEGRGLCYRDLARSNPRLIVARIRPSYNALGMIPDLELLVHARSGLLTQIRGHRPGPACCDLAVASVGAGLSAAAGALACLCEREATGLGGWVETSLYDGIQAVLPLIIGRVEHHSPSTTLLWKDQGPAEALSYRCADGEYVQLWFGAKGAYETFLEHMGDPPSEKGYNADLMSGAMVERGERWAAKFATRDRDWWIKDLAGQNFCCEPVWRPGEALRDPHVRQTGLSVGHEDPECGKMTVLGPVVRVTPVGERLPQAGPAGPTGGDPPSTPRAFHGARLLDGVRVLDLSAYGAGPLTP